MKKSMLLGMLALSATMFAATTAQVEVSANLIKAVDITAQSTTTQLVLTNVHTGDFSFPDTTLEITGGAGNAIMLKAPQNLTLSKVGGNTSVITNVTFSDGVVTTDGTDAKAIQILPASGSIQNALKISGNLVSALTEGGMYTGTVKIEANYN